MQPQKRDNIMRVPAQLCRRPHKSRPLPEPRDVVRGQRVRGLKGRVRPIVRIHEEEKIILPPVSLTPRYQSRVSHQMPGQIRGPRRIVRDQRDEEEVLRPRPLHSVESQHLRVAGRGVDVTGDHHVGVALRGAHGLGA